MPIELRRAMSRNPLEVVDDEGDKEEEDIGMCKVLPSDIDCVIAELPEDLREQFGEDFEETTADMFGELHEFVVWSVDVGVLFFFLST